MKKEQEHKKLIEESRKFLAQRLDDPELQAELHLISKETSQSIDALKKRLMGKR